MSPRRPKVEGRELLAGKEPIVYVDGEFHPKSTAKVSVYDHGFLYGDGVFEGIRAYGGIVFRLDDHMDRLYNCAKTIKLTIPMPREQLVAALVETLRKNALKDAYIRLVVSRGTGDLGVDPRKCRKASIVIITEPVELAHGAAARQLGVSAIISSVRRDAVDGTSHEIKSLNYLNSVLAKLEAIDAGADEAIMLDHRGFVSEATTTNVFIVVQSEIVTPPSVAGILHGITRKRVIQLANELGFKIHERDITPFELINSDEAFLTGTLAEIVPLVKVKGIPIGDGRPGDITRRMLEEFARIRSDPREGTPVYEAQAKVARR